MDKTEMEARLRALTVWQRGDQRAPHKPLLLLLLIARAERGDGRWVSFAELEQPLAELLREFGPARRAVHPEFSFWHLQSDGVWELSDRASALTPSGKLSPRQLRDRGVEGGLSRELWDLLRGDPAARARAAGLLLEAHFPGSLHEELLDAVGLHLSPTAGVAQADKRVRSPEFREKVLQAYEYRCAVCGFDVRLGHTPVALEAAHVKWFQAGGPDEIRNGLALCSLHHKLLDRGVIAISPERRIVVSERANGYGGFDEWVAAYHSAPLRPPRREEYTLAEAFARWHVREVFQGGRGGYG